MHEGRTNCDDNTVEGAATNLTGEQPDVRRIFSAVDLSAATSHRN